VSHLTLEDIAKKAGVSRSTVSRVVNGYKSVSVGTRQRVLAVVNETGYQPNAAARTLASQRSQMIGLVLPHSVSLLFTDPYFPYLIKGITQACNQHGYTLALFLFSMKEEEDQFFNRVPNRGLLDGVLVQSDHKGDQQIVCRLLESQVPQVVIGRPVHPENVSFVDIDNTRASYNAVTHLARLGYQRIATITGPPASTVGIDRKEGYLKALTERGFSIDPQLIVEGDFTDQGGFYAMQKLFSAQPDAVFVASDMMAIGAIRAIRDQGLRVPEDVAVIGFDDFPLLTLADVELTTVRQPVVETGVKAVEMLIDMIENGDPSPRHVILNTKLIIRASCGSLMTMRE
jgi:LacI family transcriptional regulator